MTIYVTVVTEHGVMEQITAYLTPASAKNAERRWLQQERIRTTDERETAFRNGNGFVLRECPLKP